MTTFWIICALLLVIALLFVVLPLWRSTVQTKLVQRDAANLEIFRDQIAEMDTDLRNGLLTPELYEQGKLELQARLLDEVKNPEGTGSNLTVLNSQKAVALVLVVIIPLAAVGLYSKLGNFDALQPQGNLANMNGLDGPHSDAVVKELEEKLAKEPEDAQGWELLARSYSQMKRYADAARAYDNLTRLMPHDAGLWADYADMQGMANNQNLAGLPTKLLNKALEIDPNNIKALALAGTAAMNAADYPNAISYWEKAVSLLPKDSEDAKMFEAGIQHVRKLSFQPKESKPSMQAQIPASEEQKPAVASGKERITGMVTLSDSFKGKAGPDDTLFVLARATEGPKMPLAIVRTQVKDLPLKFTLDDSTAMMPQMKLSNFEKVVVIARISKSGQPIAQPGDLEGMSAPLKPGATDLKISIDKIVQ